MLRDSEKNQLDPELILENVKKILQKAKEAVYKQQEMLETTEPGKSVLWKKLIIIFPIQHTTTLDKLSKTRRFRAVASRAQ